MCYLFSTKYTFCFIHYRVYFMFLFRVISLHTIYPKAGLVIPLGFFCGIHAAKCCFKTGPGGAENGNFSPKVADVQQSSRELKSSQLHQWHANINSYEIFPFLAQKSRGNQNLVCSLCQPRASAATSSPENWPCSFPLPSQGIYRYFSEFHDVSPMWEGVSQPSQRVGC